jgi:alpha-tubulin suppressor-like RCC1 family protein
MRNSITCIKRMAAAGLAVLLALAILLAGGTTTALAAGPGIVVAWGDNTFGQLNVPAGLNDAIAIAAGYGFSLALKRDGTVVAWVYNTSG